VDAALVVSADALMALVGHAMVPAAHQDESLRVGAPVVGPPFVAVMHVAEACTLVASGVLAVLVAADDGTADRGWNGARAPADVEGLAATGHDDAADGAVAGDASSGLGADGPEVLQLAASLDAARFAAHHHLRRRQVGAQPFEQRGSRQLARVVVP